MALAQNIIPESSSDWIIHSATPEDHHRVSSLLEASYGTLMQADYEPDVLEKVLEIITKPSPVLLSCGTWYLVVPKNDLGAVPWACGGWTPFAPHQEPKTPMEAHVRHFAVHPDHHHQGLAAALLHRSEQEARDAGATCLHCWSTLTAVGFYEKLGMRPVESFDVMLANNAPFPSVRMVKEFSV